MYGINESIFYSCRKEQKKSFIPFNLHTSTKFIDLIKGRLSCLTCQKCFFFVSEFFTQARLS